jgi:hypothetical protein
MIVAAASPNCPTARPTAHDTLASGAATRDSRRTCLAINVRCQVNNVSGVTVAMSSKTRRPSVLTFAARRQR